MQAIAYYKIFTLENDSFVTEGSIDYTFAESEGLLDINQSERYFASQANDCDEEITSIAFDSFKSQYLVTYKTVYAVISL